MADSRRRGSHPVCLIASGIRQGAITGLLVMCLCDMAVYEGPYAMILRMCCVGLYIILHKYYAASLIMSEKILENEEVSSRSIDRVEAKRVVVYGLRLLGFGDDQQLLDASFTIMSTSDALRLFCLWVMRLEQRTSLPIVEALWTGVGALSIICIQMMLYILWPCSTILRVVVIAGAYFAGGILEGSLHYNNIMWRIYDMVLVASVFVAIYYGIVVSSLS